MSARDETPQVISFLLPEEAAAWPTKEPGKVARRDLVEKAILKAARERTFSAHKKLEQLIEAEFRAISPVRATQLQEMLAKAFDGRLDLAHQGAINAWRDRFTTSLLEWRMQSIFQAAKYRKLLVDCWAEALRLARDEIELLDRVNFVGNETARGFLEANRNGQHYRISKGEAARTRHAKVRTGLANHIDATLEAASEFEREARAASRLAIIKLCAASVSGLLEGVGQSEFVDDDGQTVTPYELLSQSDASWNDIQSVLHIISFSSRQPPRYLTDWLAREGLEKQLLDGLWLAAHQIGKEDGRRELCPVPKRAGVVGQRLEFDIVGIRESGPSEQVLVAVFLAPVRVGKHIRDLLTETTSGPRYGLIVARQQVQDTDRVESQLLTQIPWLPVDVAPPTANRVAAEMRHALKVATDSGVNAAVIETRNFPQDFPLEEWSRLSEKYLVERPAVEAFVQRLLERRGLHMSCGMRRGGKTTAFHRDVLRRMQVHTDDVVVETCRDNGPLASRFFGWLQHEFARSGELPNAALDDWFATNLGAARLFVLDEFEALFRWLVGIAQEKPTARTLFVDRLLDGFVRASERWGFLFLGLEPGVSRIFMADNPLAPRMQMHSFPYFQHDKGSRTSEFARLVQVVITEHLDIDSLLLDRLWYESGGHPHFAVSLLRSLVDWSLTHKRLKTPVLEIGAWEPFAKHRLSPLMMRQSEWFQAYKSLHEGWRVDHSPWVRGVTKLAEAIGDEECPTTDAVAELMKTQNRDEDWAYTAIDDALTANLLTRDDLGASIRLTVPAYGRLAASWRRR